MKLPRWLVTAMLAASVLLVLTAAGWWWVTWPERTMRVFVEHVTAAEGSDLSEMIADLPERMRDRIRVSPEGLLV